MDLSFSSVDVGATGWLLTMTTLVSFMAPGVSFFYSGMLREKNALSSVMQGFTAIAVVSVAWTMVGFSLAFGEGTPILGDFTFVGLFELDKVIHGGIGSKVPLLAFVAFQMVLAIFAAVLATGAAAERWRFSAYMIFITLWSIVVYAPVAHWLFSPTGWASKQGAHDFAGGLVIHVNAGASAIAIALLLGKRRGWPETEHRPHNLPLALLGAALLWFGWFGLTGGSAQSANEIAAIAMINTALASSAALLVWIALEYGRFGKSTTLGAVSGLVVGLVAISPAAGYIPPWAALSIGGIAGLACHFTVGLKTRLRIDDSLDVAAVHLVGGVTGTVCVGLFSSRSINPDCPNGLVFGGGFTLVKAQAIATVAVLIYGLVITLFLGVLVNQIIKHRVRPVEEAVGLDLSQHGETAYYLAIRDVKKPVVEPISELASSDIELSSGFTDTAEYADVSFTSDNC